MNKNGALTFVWLKEGWNSALDGYHYILPAVLSYQITAVLPSLLFWKYFENRWYALPWEIVIGAPMTVGMNLFFINLNRSGRADYGDLFRGFSVLPAAIAVSFAYGIIVTAGLVMLVVPGVVWGLAYIFAQYSVIDAKTGVRASFARSSRLSNGFKERLLPVAMLWVMLEIFTPGVMRAEGSITSMRLVLDLKPWVVTAFLLKTMVFLPWLDMAMARAYLDLVKHDQRLTAGEK
ncbi:MAG: hypothetical protein WCW52_02695 [Elusimicrobiales bacterium]|jgi:hypothetical protein